MGIKFPSHLRVPPRHLWLFPFVSGASWLLTLTALLITWIAKGMPRYPHQTNPYVAFISNIAAFQLKPVFFIGSTITGFAFIGTIYSVHWARYDPRMYGIDDARWKKTISLTSVMAGTIAGISLSLLSAMDTFRYHKKHRILLMICFGGLFVTCLCTAVVYFDQILTPSPFKRLRTYCMISTVLVLCQVGIGVSFIALLYEGYYRIAGCLEWTETFLGGFYVLTFIGFVAAPEEGINNREREALLQSQE
ncbi:hypothetical protein M501DRAFT_477228 [Patellaria atrata CBS 101060]|uniref:CWH43-like N-terminal domain-containing protein n=1 Tax=Patellaria atrata CBS 101060 TaxID=1346257 RepID=A0A9P4S3H4_9PEZI|nr:hypothetical protein M501DRAFT_477228 [Patellaria atrata CBS 101060]